MSARAAAFSAHAQRYSELGWALIRTEGKTPREAGWQTATPVELGFAAGQWARWGERYNIGVVLGQSVPPLAVLEYDAPDARDQFLDLLGGRLPQTPACKTGSGRGHVYFENTERVPPAARGGLELRAGGQQCLLPPSLHPETGKPYDWVLGHAPWEVALAPLTPEIVAFFRSARNGAGPAAPLAEVIPEGERNRTLASLAGSMRRRGGSEAAILAALRAENERCQPPLSEDELARIAHSIARYAPAENAAPIPFRSLGIQAGGKENQVVSEGEVERSSTLVPHESHLHFQSLASFVEKAPAEPAWSWRGFLGLYVLALLAGRPKVGKSTLAMALVAAAVRGGDFLGLSTNARGVLLLTEERRDTLAEKARALGLMDADVPVYVLTRYDAGDTPWPDVVRQAMTFCREHEVDVLIVDTLDRWTGLRGDAENAAGAVNEAMEPLQFAAASGLAVLALSHQRKSGGEFGEAVRGSNAFTGAVDVVIELERPAKSLQLGAHARVLRSVSRFSSTPEELFFELGDDGFDPISNVVDRRTEAERAQVLDALVRHGEAVHVDELHDLLGGELGPRVIRGRLGELHADGLIVRSGAGKKGDPYLWEAAEDRHDAGDA